MAAQSLAIKTDDLLLQVCAIDKLGIAIDKLGIAYAVDGQYKECMTEFDRALTGLPHRQGERLPESLVYWSRVRHLTLGAAVSCRPFSVRRPW